MFNSSKLRSVLSSNNDLSKGTFNGTVVDNGDPLKLGRIKVEIPELSKGLPRDKLPWYIGRKNPSSSPNATQDIPPVGSQVVVEFTDNDFYNGQYSYIIVSKPPKAK